MNKKDLSESDIKAKFITPAILKSGWDKQTQLGREIFFTDGRIYVKGKLTARGKREFADYILFYKQFSREFFDLIIIDECHRGSAKEDSKWREILEYFNTATHIGLTATTKETTEVSNTEYFGEPIYAYSLKQGIDDGFLAPYKVVKITLDIDAEGWRPPKGFLDKDEIKIDVLPQEVNLTSPLKYFR